MNKPLRERKTYEHLKVVYCISSVVAFLGGTLIYVLFRNINNMTLFHFFQKPTFLTSLYNPIKTESIWSDMFIYNLPYGLWCLSGLLLIRGIWLQNRKWRSIYGSIFIAIVMFYVILKIPKIIPGTFDVLDLVFMGFFAFMESIIFSMFIRRYL